MSAGPASFLIFSFTIAMNFFASSLYGISTYVFKTKLCTLHSQLPNDAGVFHVPETHGTPA